VDFHEMAIHRIEYDRTRKQIKALVETTAHDKGVCHLSCSISASLRIEDQCWMGQAFP